MSKLNFGFNKLSWIVQIEYRKYFGRTNYQTDDPMNIQTNLNIAVDSAILNIDWKGFCFNEIPLICTICQRGEKTSWG